MTQILHQQTFPQVNESRNKLSIKSGEQIILKKLTSMISQIFSQIAFNLLIVCVPTHARVIQGHFTRETLLRLLSRLRNFSHFKRKVYLEYLLNGITCTFV